ncbi:MAG: fibronectin type III domain-containing protein, partial [Endomicrobiales bacterium]|nr:fibronectin type III domain-containing protein [Endomicrobiales bacterium]
MLNQLQAGSVFALQYSQSQGVVWSTASAQIIIVTTSSINPGDSQSVTLSSSALSGNTTYYFKLWTRDENVDCWSNTSAMSSAYILLGDTIAPAAVTTLVARTADTLGGNVKLSWGAPGDDGMFGSLPVGSQYKVQYATVASGDSLSGWNYPLAQITVSTSNVTSGDVVSQIVGPLTSGVTYYFAIWNADEVSNWSAVSNISSACASEALPITSGTISGIMSYNGSFVGGVYKVAIASAIGDNGVMSFVTPITSFTGAGYYSFSNLSLPNTFYVMALIDENDNDVPDGYEPIGYFRQASNWWNATPIYLSASSHTASNVDFSLFDFGAISGHITNNSEQIGNIVVIASPSFGGASPYNVTESTPNTPAWDYSLRVSTPYSFYKVTAFVDVNENGRLDSNEYYSIYADSVPVASQFNSLGIDITINTAPPAAPGSFSGAVQSTGSIQWSWTLSANATYYAIYNGTDDSKVGNVEGVTQWLEVGLSSNTQYTRYVKAGNISGISGASNSDAKYTYAIIPSSVSVNAVNVSSITLSWANTGANSYRLERDSVFVASVTGTSYSDTSLSADTYYAYRVGAINNELVVSPGYSSVANVLTLPASPSGFVGIAIGTDTIKWQWNHGSTYVSGYNLYTSTGFELAIGLVSNVTAYIETGLNANTQYTRVLKQYNGAGLSSATATQKYTYAIIPSSVSVNAVNVSSVTLGWADTGAIAYRLERNSVFIATVPATSYSDTSLNADTIYAYRVGAINNELVVSPGYSSVTNVLTLPASPSDFVGIAIGTDTIKWQWNHGTTYVSGYNLYDSLGNGIALGLTSDVTAYIESGLALNTTHYRYLTQYNSSGESGATNLVGRFTLPRTPQSASFSEVYYTSATLNWDANGNASTTTIYEVIQSTDSNFGSYTTPVPFVSRIRTTTVLINTLIPGATSYFKVRAQNSDGIAGDYSNVASAFVVVKTRKWVSTSLSNSLNSEAWEPAGVPQNGETIIFDGTGNGDCHWVSDISIASMTILSPSASTIMLISDLNIDGDLDMQSGYMSTEGGSTITIKGDWKQTGGIVTLNTGGVSFAGTLAQKVIQTQNSYFNNFSVITSSYVQANSNLNIKGDLYFPSGAGSFNANNNAVQMGSLSMYAGSFIAGSATHTITGNFLVSGGAGFDAGTGALSFAGTTDQTIYPGSAGFNNVLIESTGTVSTLGTMNVFGNFDINHGGFDTNNAQVSLRGSGNMTQKAGTTFNPRGTWQTHGIQTQTLSPLLGTFDVFEVYGTSLTKIITPAASVQISSMLVSGNSQFDCYGAKPMTVINTLYIDGKFNLNDSTLTAIGGIGAYNSSTFDMGNGSIYLAGGSTISVSGILNTYGTYNTITSNAGYFGFIISGATLNVNGLTLSGSNGVSIDTFTIVNGMFGFRKINFLNTKPGATAITFMPATGVYIMQNCSFDANVGVNVSAINMSSPSVNDIRMDNATGAKAGHAYENDPNNVVFWGTPSAFTFFTGRALSDNSIEVSWSDVNEETSYTIYSGTTDVSGELPAGTTSFMGTGLLPNKAYTAFARAHNPVGYTDSTSSSIYTLSKSPSSLATLGVTSDTIRVSWYENTNPDGTQYKLYYSTDQASFT